jgi:hypothetical protein
VNRVPRSPSRFLQEALAHDVRTRFVGHDPDGDLYSAEPARDLSGALSYSEYLREHVGPLAQTEIQRDLLLDDGGYSGADFGGPYVDRTSYSAADRRGMVEQPFRGTGADDMTTTRYGLGPEGHDALTGIGRWDDTEFGAEVPDSELDGGAGDEFLASGSFGDHFRDFRSADEEDGENGVGAEGFGFPYAPATAPLGPASLPQNQTGYSDAAVQLAAEEWDESNPEPAYTGSLLVPQSTTVLQPLPQFDGDSVDASAAEMPDDPPLSYGEGVAIVGASAAVVGGTMWWLGCKGWWWLGALPLTYAAAGLVGVAYVLGKANHGDAAAKAWESSVQGQMLQARLIQRKILV